MALSGEIFKENFIDIFHTQCEQIAFSLESSKPIEQEGYRSRTQDSTSYILSREQKIFRNFVQQKIPRYKHNSCLTSKEEFSRKYKDKKTRVRAFALLTRKGRRSRWLKLCEAKLHQGFVPLFSPTCSYLPSWCSGGAKHSKQILVPCRAVSQRSKEGQRGARMVLLKQNLFANLKGPSQTLGVTLLRKVTPSVCVGQVALPTRVSAGQVAKPPKVNEKLSGLEGPGGSATKLCSLFEQSNSGALIKKAKPFTNAWCNFAKQSYTKRLCGVGGSATKHLKALRIEKKQLFYVNENVQSKSRVEPSRNFLISPKQDFFISRRRERKILLNRKIGDYLSSGDKIGHLLSDFDLVTPRFTSAQKKKFPKERGFCNLKLRKAEKSRKKFYLGAKQSRSIQSGTHSKMEQKKREPVLLSSSGRVVTISKTQLILEKTQPVLFYNSANLNVKKGEWVKKGSPILTLTHQTLVTGDIVQGIPRIEQLFEAFTRPSSTFKDREPNKTKFRDVYETLHSRVRDIFRKHWFNSVLPIAVRKSLEEIQYTLVESIQKVYLSQGVLIADKHIEIVIRQIASKGQILDSGTTGLFLEEILPIRHIENANLATPGKKCLYVPAVVGLTAAALSSDSFISAASFQETTRVLSRDAVAGKTDFLRGLKEKVVIGDLISAGTGLDIYFIYTTMMAG